MTIPDSAEDAAPVEDAASSGDGEPAVDDGADAAMDDAASV